MPYMLIWSQQWPVPGTSTHKTQERGPGVCQKESVHYDQTISVQPPGPGSSLVGWCLLHRPARRPPPPCPLPYPALEPCTQVQEPASELDKQLQVCQGSGDGHLHTKRCLLDIMSSLVTNLALHYLPHPSATSCKLWDLRFVAGLLEHPHSALCLPSST